MESSLLLSINTNCLCNHHLLAEQQAGGIVATVLVALGESWTLISVEAGVS